MIATGTGSTIAAASDRAPPPPSPPRTASPRVAASEAPESSRSRTSEEAAEREVAEVTLQQRRSWVALSAIPVVYGAEDVRAEAIAHGTTDLALELQNPPRASYLALPERLLPDARLCGETDSLPYIIAAVPGVLLVRTTDLARGRGAINPVDFLCDVRSGTATRLPAVPAELSTRSLPQRRSLGLVADPRSPGHYVVAQLHRAYGKVMGRHGALVCYSTATGQWTVKTLASAPDHKRWGKHGVFAHGGLLCWVDVAYGMVICDPFEEHPNLRLVTRPPGSEKRDGPRSTTLMNQRRCIRPSQGVLRYMEIEGLSYSMWSLVNPAGPTHWKFEHKVPFSKIWAHQSYLNAGLPKDKIPSLALVDPDDHDVVYFFQDAWLFGNMRAGEITAYEECWVDRNLHDPKFHNSRFLHAWDRGRAATVREHPASSKGTKPGCSDGVKRNILFIDGPNPLGHLLAAAPQPNGENPPPSADNKQHIQDALTTIQQKLSREISRQAIEKLIRERKYLQEMLETSDD